MTKYMYFCGRGATTLTASREALKQCADLIVNFPSLVVELVEMVPNASGYDAHLRVTAISNEIGTKKFKSNQTTHASLEIKPDDDLGRRNGVEHEAGYLSEQQRLFTIMNFDIAAKDGAVLDIPIQDIDQFKGLGMSVDEVRDYLKVRQDIYQKKFNIN